MLTNENFQNEFAGVCFYNEKLNENFFADYQV